MQNFKKLEKAMVCNRQYAIDKGDAFLYLMSLEEENNLNQIKRALKEMEEKSQNSKILYKKYYEQHKKCYNKEKLYEIYLGINFFGIIKPFKNTT